MLHGLGLLVDEIVRGADVVREFLHEGREALLALGHGGQIQPEKKPTQART